MPAQLGIVVGLSRNPGDPASATVTSWTALPPCSWKTPRGIGIGDTAEALSALYADAVDPEWGRNGGNLDILIGSVYGGILATVENGKIVSLFFGAMAE